MEGEPASWDLIFAGIKFFTCSLHPPSRTHAASFRQLGGAGAGSDPRSGAAGGQAPRSSGAHSPRVPASQVGPGCGHLPCTTLWWSPGMGSGHPAAEGWCLAPEVRFLKLSFCLERRDWKAEAVPGECAAGARLNLRTAALPPPPPTTSPRPSGRRAPSRALQSWRGLWGSPAAPPRGCRTGSGPQGPGRAGDHAVSPRAPPPAARASASSTSLTSQVRAGCGAPPGPPRPWPGPIDR